MWKGKHAFPFSAGPYHPFVNTQLYWDLIHIMLGIFVAVILFNPHYHSITKIWKLGLREVAIPEATQLLHGKGGIWTWICLSPLPEIFSLLYVLSAKKNGAQGHSGWQLACYHFRVLSLCFRDGHNTAFLLVYINTNVYNLSLNPWVSLGWTCVYI